MSLATLSTTGNRAALARARGAIARHAQAFRSLEAEAVRLAEAGEPLAAAVWAQSACHFAAHNPCGILGSPALEGLLHAVGRDQIRGPAVAARPPRPPGAPERVLHVFTETYPVGGHTRAALRWMERDEGRVPTALLLAQAAPLPDAVPATVHALGGELTTLPQGNLFARARALRAFAADHDLVVLHTGAQDVLPALAFADPEGRPPVILFDHASHQFWIGSGCADLVAAVSAPDAANVVGRRGVPASRVVVLPLPVSPRPLPDRTAARRALGVEDEATPVLLSIVSDWRVRHVVEPAFTELVADVLAAAPETVLVAVGPEPGGAWAELERRTGGRARALGPQADIGVYLAAADLFLDSWPACGGTTLLDVAGAGLAAVALGDRSPDLALVRPRGTVLDAGLVLAETPEALAATVARLIRDPAARSAVGAALAEGIDADHGSGWTDHLRTAVDAARRLAGTAAPPASVPAPEAPAWEAITFLLQDGGPWTPQASVLCHQHLLPPHLRPDDPRLLAVRVDEVLDRGRAGERRAVATPDLEAAAVAGAVEELRRLLDAGTVTSCAVLVASDRLDEAIPLLEAALESGGDLELDVLVADALEDVAGPLDLVVGSAA